MFRLAYIKLITYTIFFFGTLISLSQSNFNDTTYNPDDYTVLDGYIEWQRKKLEEKGKLDKLQKKLDKRENKKVFFAVIPSFNYNPFTGFAIGANSNIAFKTFNSNETSLSNILAAYLWTTKRQQFAKFNANIFTKDDSFYLYSSFIWSISPQHTYGTGGNTPENWSTYIDPAYFNITARVYKKTYDRLFLGLNFQFYQAYKIDDVSGNEIIDDIRSGQQSSESAESVYKQITGENPGYANFWDSKNLEQSGFASDFYSETPEYLQERYFPTPYGYYPYGTTNMSTFSGFGLNILWDSRDNITTTYKGTYANMYLNMYPKWLGSTYNAGMLYIDLRQFIPVSKNNRQIIGLWSIAHLTFGDIPYANLPKVGGDDWFASGRGYTAGRYVGENFFYLEAEYRINVWKWLGFVAFANAHIVTDFEQNQLYVNPGTGVGIRIRAIKNSRANICLDVAIGKDGSTGIYGRFIEAF